MSDKRSVREKVADLMGAHDQVFGESFFAALCDMIERDRIMGASARHFKQLEDEVSRLQGEVANRNSRALEGDKAVAAFNKLLADYERLRPERDEADRRAGAAERKLGYAQDSINARECWLRKAKEQWGVDNNVSFDKVWEGALNCRDLLKLVAEIDPFGSVKNARIRDGAVAMLAQKVVGCE